MVWLLVLFIHFPLERTFYSVIELDSKEQCELIASEVHEAFNIIIGKVVLSQTNHKCVALKKTTADILKKERLK